MTILSNQIPETTDLILDFNFLLISTFFLINDSDPLYMGAFLIYLGFVYWLKNIGFYIM